MGYARHIGRVGALAVTLGVGAAIANTPRDCIRRPIGPVCNRRFLTNGHFLINKEVPNNKKVPTDE